jgi:hypothetical protein
MPAMPRFTIAILSVLFVFSFAFAQGPAQSTAGQSGPTITASATGERVRITAPSSVVQMHVEVYAASGEKLFDQEIRGGNVFDWHLQDGQAQRLAPGAYVCVVTAKSVSGKLTQKIGTVTVEQNSVSVQADSPQLSVQQTQAIGPVEEDSSWTIPGKDEPQTTTVIANDGTDGQMIRGRGALTFRIGDFFSGIDTEQMRLTEEGNLGIGTSEPKAKLDVAGTIRAERFLIAKPKLAGGDKTASLAADSGDSAQPLATGSGTQNQIAKWADNSGLLGNSGITETAGGNVGIGTASPGAQLDVVNPSSSSILRIKSTSGGVAVLQLDAPNTSSFIDFNNAGVNKGEIFYYHPTNYMAFNTNGSEKVRINTNGNVGIGTASPGTTLHVKGPGNYEGIIRADSNAVDTYTGYGWYENGTKKWSVYNHPTIADTLLFANASGVDKVAIAQNGNVGIGTTNPGDTLTVNGDSTIGKAQSSGSTTSAVAYDEGSGFVGFQKRGTTRAGNMGLGNNASEVASTSGNLGLFTYNSGYLALGTNDIERLRVDTSGNVGIGISVPSAKLQVSRGSIRLDDKWGLEFGGGADLISGGNGTHFLDFWTNNNRRVLIDSAGNVGIGIDPPGARLHVDGGGICVGPYCNDFEGRIIASGSGGEFTFVDRGATSFVEAPTSGERWGWYGNGGRARLWSGTDKLSVDPSGVLRVLGTVQSSTTPDIAETIAADTSVTAADVVCADPLHRERAVRCSKNDRAILGVISDGTGGFLINSNAKSTDAPLTGMPLVLAGRVPVRVSLENGPIQIGDFLAPSSTPGVAMRASEPGPTIGIALEAFNPETREARAKPQTGTVLCFIKAGQADISATLTRMNQDNKRLQQQNAALKTRLDRLEQEQSKVKSQQTKIDLLKKLVCLDHPGEHMCKRTNLR